MRITRGRLLRSAAVLAVTATAITLAGCQTGGGGEEDQVLNISSTFISGNPMGDVFQEQMKRFTEETGIEVNITEVANDDSQTVFEADYLAGKEADVMTINIVGDNQSWVVDGLTQDVAPLMAEWGLTDRVSSDAVQGWTNADGQQSGFPYVGFVWPIWYNQAIFDEAGVEIPTTYEDLVAASAAIRAIGKQPFAVAGGDWPGQNFMTWIAQQFLDKDEATELFSNGGWCEPKALQGLELLSEMTTNGVFIDDVEGYTADTMTSAYFNGDAAMMPSGSWAMSTAPEDIQANTVLGGFPLPEGAAWDKPGMFFGDTSSGLWITRNGEKKMDLAEQWVKFMYSPETVAAFVEGADLITPLVVEDAQAANPLVGQAAGLRDIADSLVLWDTLLPVGADVSADAVALYAGTSAADTCASMEAIYQDALGG